MFRNSKANDTIPARSKAEISFREVNTSTDIA